MPTKQKTYSQNKESSDDKVKTIQKISTIQTPIVKQQNPVEIIQRVRMSPDSLTRNDVRQLQSTIGNRAVIQLLSKLKGNLKPQNGGEAVQLKGGDMRKTQSTGVSKTGMPHNLKAGLESLSGLDMSDVRVHHNSDKPQQVGALAYTQGSDIHVAPGQEKHLPHEGWHVVQQKQGRVRPTLQMRTGVSVNDDAGLEREADIMGAKAATGAAQGSTVQLQNDSIIQRKHDSGKVIQLSEPTKVKSLFAAKSKLVEAKEAVAVIKDEIAVIKNAIGAVQKEKDVTEIKEKLKIVKGKIVKADSQITEADKSKDAIIVEKVAIVVINLSKIVIPEVKDMKKKLNIHELTLPDVVNGDINGKKIKLNPNDNWSAYEYKSKKGETGKTKEGRYKIAVGPKILNTKYPDNGKIWDSEFDGLNKNIDVVLVSKKTGEKLNLKCYVTDIKAHTYNKYNDGGKNVSFGIESGLVQTGAAYPNSWNYSHETPFSEKNSDGSVIEFIVKPTDFNPNDYKLSKVITYN